jgi:hypothetical protein
MAATIKENIHLGCDDVQLVELYPRYEQIFSLHRDILALALPGPSVLINVLSLHPLLFPVRATSSLTLKMKAAESLEIP